MQRKQTSVTFHSFDAAIAVVARKTSYILKQLILKRLLINSFL